MGMYMKASGLITRQTGMVCILMLKVLDTKVSGGMINSMGKALRSGMRVHSTMDTTSTERRKVKGSTLGLMVLFMMVNGLTTESMAKESTYGRMGENTMENGRTTICKVSEFTTGVTVVATKVSMIMIRNAVSVFTIGPMVVDTKAGGTKVSSMALVAILFQRKKK
jgi:hypothetical protein